MTRAGELRYRITLQTNTPTANSIGEYVDTYADFATVWAAIDPLSGRLLFEAQQASSEVQGRIRIRPLDGLLPTMRIKYGDRYFKILSIIETDNEQHILYKEWLD